jgi:cytochrome-b5 reductase
MIAGGTGITPMLQIIRAALKNPQDPTRLRLIYANVNYEDVLLKKELDELADKYSSRFEVFYVLNNPPTGWTGGVGFVSKEQIATHLPASHDNIKILLCGKYTYGQNSTPYEHLYRPSPNDDSHEVRHSYTFLFSRLMLCTRKHLDELKYPAPRTVSKLVDQVGAPSFIRLSGLLTLISGLPVLN